MQWGQDNPPPHTHTKNISQELEEGFISIHFIYIHSAGKETEAQRLQVMCGRLHSQLIQKQCSPH